MDVRQKESDVRERVDMYCVSTEEELGCEKIEQGKKLYKFLDTTNFLFNKESYYFSRSKESLW